MLEGDVRDAKIDTRMLRDVLSDDDFLRFLAGKAQLDGACEFDDREYPGGEEPDPDDGDSHIEDLGYAHEYSLF